MAAHPVELTLGEAELVSVLPPFVPTGMVTSPMAVPCSAR